MNKTYDNIFNDVNDDKGNDANTDENNDVNINSSSSSLFLHSSIIKFISFVLIISLVIYFVSIYKEASVPKRGIIYKGDELIRSMTRHGGIKCLNEKVDKITIVKTTVNTNIFPFLSTNCFSHWALLLITKSNKYIIVSSSGDETITVYLVNKNNEIIKVNINGKQYTVINCKKTDKYIMCEQMNNVGDKGITANEIIYEMYKIVTSIKYSTYTYNCHFIVKYIMNYLGLSEFPTTNAFETFKNCCTDLICGNVCRL